MSYTLRPYQRAAIDCLYNHMRMHDDNPVAVLPTGSGKTICLAELIRHALTTWPGTRIAVVAHVKELVEQNADKLKRYWPEARIGIYAASLKRRDRFEPVIFASIQSVYNRAMQLGRFDLILVDEAHRIPIRGEGMYRQFIADCQRANPDLRVIGLTATPYRLGTGPVTGPDYILNSIAYEASVKDLIEQGYLCKLVSKGGAARADLSGVHVRGGEYVASELEAAVNRTELVESAVDEMLAYCQDRRAWIVFCASVAHAEAVKTCLNTRGISAAVVEGNTPLPEREATIARFQRGELRALVNVNVLSEGFDAPHVDAVILLRPTKSPGLYYQQCLDSETEILTRTGWKGIGEVTNDDEIAAADYRFDTPKLSWERPIEVIERPLGTERMLEISAPGVDMRLTAGHEMILKSRRQKGWKREAVEHAAQRRSDYKIPVATVESMRAAPLSDDEIRFIGWFMTDGNLNKHNNAITISQSSRQPWFDEIDRVLVSCGFKYAKRLVTAKTQFNESAPRYNFIISKGEPRGRNKHLSGWGRLESWLSKDFSPKLESLDERQFGILLEAIHLDDGSKQARQPWVRRSYHVVTVNRVFADRLQSLCLRRGWRCNIGRSHSRGSELLTLHMKKQSFRCIGGTSQVDRQFLTESVSNPDERVWCVRVHSGAFVARRNGKAFVTGNCGRGLRLHPSKQDCLVLDFAGNILEHGPIDAIRVEKPKKRGDKAKVVTAPTKQCPACAELILASLIRCPECEFEFPRVLAKHDRTASDAPILSNEQRQALTQTFRVNAVRYALHEKPGGIPSLRVEYQSGLRTFREWICLEHGGPIRARAVAWWKARMPAHLMDDPGNYLVPRTIDNALNYVHHLRQPTHIHVFEGGKYPEIVHHEFDEPDPGTESGNDSDTAKRTGDYPGTAGEPRLPGVHSL